MNRLPLSVSAAEILVPPGFPVSDRASRPTRWRVAIVEGHALVAAGLRMAVDDQADCEVVLETPSVGQCKDLLTGIVADVVVLNCASIGGDPLAQVRELAAQPGLPPVLVLMTSLGGIRAGDLIRVGASGLLLTSVDLADLLTGIRSVASGGRVLSCELLTGLWDEVAESPLPMEEPEAVHELTARETEVLSLVGRGMTNAQIAQSLLISPATAKSHISRILTRTGVSGRAGLVLLAIRAGLV